MRKYLRKQFWFNAKFFFSPGRILRSIRGCYPSISMKPLLLKSWYKRFLLKPEKLLFVLKKLIVVAFPFKPFKKRLGEKYLNEKYIESILR